MIKHCGPDKEGGHDPPRIGPCFQFVKISLWPQFADDKEQQRREDEDAKDKRYNKQEIFVFKEWKVKNIFHVRVYYLTSEDPCLSSVATFDSLR